MTDRYQRGIAVVKELAGEQGLKALEEVNAFSPDFARIITEFGFGEIYTRPHLDLKQRELLTLSALITLDAENQLPFHFYSALNSGFTQAELIEITIHCAAYAGFPRALNALQVLQKVCAARNMSESPDEQK
jgi:4-carboxymuconolactone decarboxylase